MEAGTDPAVDPCGAAQVHGGQKRRQGRVQQVRAGQVRAVQVSVSGREAAPASTLAVMAASLPAICDDGLLIKPRYELQRDRANICTVKGANPHLNGARRRAKPIQGRNHDLRLGDLVRSIMG